MTAISATSFQLVSNRAEMARADMIDKIHASAVCDVVAYFLLSLMANLDKWNLFKIMVKTFQKLSEISENFWKFS